MFCINCGTQLPEGAKFCFKCGADMNQFFAGSDKETTNTSPKAEAILGCRYMWLKPEERWTDDPQGSFPGPSLLSREEPWN